MFETIMSHILSTQNEPGFPRLDPGLSFHFIFIFAFGPLALMPAGSSGEIMHTPTQASRGVPFYA